jgi:UDP-2,4-diacetamido-2,4,6-trideoxy-beta-L-altropyranose hydrolase
MMISRREANGLSLRPASWSDAAHVWEWNNRPEVRAASRKTSLIPWSEHARWFRARLSDPHSWLWMIEAAPGTVGVVRIQQRGARPEISISLAAEARGQGLGRAAVQRACRAFTERAPSASLDAWIAEDNPASLRCFLACGFRQIPERDIQHPRFVCLRWHPGPQGGENDPV